MLGGTAFFSGTFVPTLMPLNLGPRLFEGRKVEVFLRPAFVLGDASGQRASNRV